ncbi:MAG: phage holin family protein [Candidatus Eisenbacteria bacterium]|uniref:Phage holin family protein n=1 Tax=Eiseniibacteriota bacterium TaxID=2212470 RepID=A0A538SR14_UNCEI|nr:MAG: phage holin family protein [Candidatus Eisenbacteria bacterium]
MNHLMYFAVMAVAMVGLSKIMPGFKVDGWIPAIFAAVVLGVVNTVVKPVLFVLTLPFTLLTLGLFLLVLNAMMLWLTSIIVPGFRVTGVGTAVVASLILAAVSMVWKAATSADS